MISTRSAFAWLAPSTGGITGKTRTAIFGACLAAIAALVASTAAVASADTSSCFTTSGKTMTLVHDCTTDSTIVVPNGVTLNGNGKTIKVVDPSSASFDGAVVANGGGQMYVKNLTINNTSTSPENCNRVFNGVAFTNGSGSVNGVTLTGIGRPATGCQIGRAILVDDTQSTLKQSVDISGNTVSDYNKNGIDVRGNVSAKIQSNTVTTTPSALIATNGIVVRSGAFAQVWSNTITGNHYIPTGVDACGILVFDGATANMTKSNTMTDNDVRFENDGGSVVGHFSA